MGITADIGQGWIDIVIDEAEKAGIDHMETFSWCRPHDNNTVCDICTCCDDDMAKVPDDKTFREHCRSWIKDSIAQGYIQAAKS